MNAASLIQRFVSEAQSRGEDVFVRLEEGDVYHLSQVVLSSDGTAQLRYGKRPGAKSYSTEVWPDARAVRSGKQLRTRDLDDEPLWVFAMPKKPQAPEPQCLMDTPENVVTATEGGYVGKKFGMLTVTAMLGYRGRNRMARCKCDCGGEKDAIVSQLLADKVISCGCQRGLNNAVPIPEGEKRGRLTILGRAERPQGNRRSGFFYRVRCECGTETVLIQERIVRPNVATCGCNLRESIVGQRYGLLTVLAGERHFNRHREHKVLCDCGNQTWARNDTLRSGKTSSCGCLRGQPQGQRFSS